MRIKHLLLTLALLGPAAAGAVACDAELTPHASAAAPTFDPARLVVTSSPRDPLVRGLIANVVATLGQFPDASLVHQIIEHQPRDLWTFDAVDLGVVAVDQALVDAVRAWVTTLAYLGPRDKASWQTIVTALHAPRLVRHLNTAAQAVVLDGAFAPFEGNGDALAAFAHPAWLAELESLANALRLDARTTSFLTPTDDSQLLVGGAYVALVGADAFADDLPTHWRRLTGEGLWRNTGRRFKSWLAGDAGALAGPTLLGDFLRLAAVLPRLIEAGATEATANADLDRLARRLGWSAAKVGIARAFVGFQRSRLALDRSAASAWLDRLIALTAVEPTKTSAFLEVARRTLWRRTDLARFFTEVSALGRDYDTYGFLAPFFAEDPVFGANDFRALGPLNQPYVASIVASALAQVGALPIEVAVRTHDAFLDHERLTRDELARRRGATDAR